MQAPLSDRPTARPFDDSPLGRSDTFTGKLAETLLALGRMSRHDLTRARAHVERTGVAFVDAIVQLGCVDEAAAYEVLADVSGLPLVSLAGVAADSLALRLVPETVARRHRVLPLHEDNRTLTYATARPFADEAERDLASMCGRQPHAVLARPSELADAIDRHYPPLGEIERLVERLRSDPDEDELGTGESPVVALCNRLIAGALDACASDIRVEPAAQGVVVRYRVGGHLQHALTLPTGSAGPVINHLKAMAQAEIATRRGPLVGAFQVSVTGRRVAVRVSVLPTARGEKLAMRVIDGHFDGRTLDELGYAPDTRARLEQALRRSDGLVLVAGPTGCGKTTVLYAALEALRASRSDVVTVEDPVERRVDGITQIAVAARAGAGLATALRSVLRRDPTVIMIGELRDAEVARIASQAARSGHLVLSSLRAGDAASAVTRLQSLGMEPSRIAGSLAAVVAQRLVRRLCPRCRIVLDPRTARAAGEARGIEAIAARSGPGCPACRFTGYAERVPVAEILVPAAALRAVIAAGAPAADVRAAMRAAGQPTLRQAGLALAARGVTSIDEIDRVVIGGIGAARRSPRPRVLIADDDPLIRMLVRMLLEQADFDVLEAADGVQAVEVARRERPDLTIVDLTMPVLDGFGAIDRIRRDVTLADTPIIVLSAEQSPGQQHRVLELGADDYLVKPLEASVVLERIRAALRRTERAGA